MVRGGIHRIVAQSYMMTDGLNVTGDGIEPIVDERFSNHVLLSVAATLRAGATISWLCVCLPNEIGCFELPVFVSAIGSVVNYCKEHRQTGPVE